MDRARRYFHSSSKSEPRTSTSTSEVPLREEYELQTGTNRGLNQPPVEEQPKDDPVSLFSEQQADPEVEGNRWTRFKNRITKMNWSRVLGTSALLLIGAGVTAAIMVGPVRLHVEYQKAHAESDAIALNHFIKGLAVSLYDQCYDGCGMFSKNLSCSFDACQRTKIEVNGTICDSDRMWTWEDKYPTECLLQLGQQFRNDALAALKDQYELQWALIIPALIAGLIVTLLVYKLWLWSLHKRSNRKRDGILEAGQVERRHPWSCSKISWCCMMTLMLLASPVNAFPCWDRSDAMYEHFEGKNGIRGWIYGWTSNCSTSSYACQTCDWKANPHGNRNYTCVETQCEDTHETMKPSQYVKIAFGKVQECGFESANFDPYVNVRIANPLLEMNKFVTIKVNKLNVSGVVDPSIECLWNIGNL